MSQSQELVKLSSQSNAPEESDNNNVARRE